MAKRYYESSQREKRELKSAIGDAIAAFCKAHQAEPERIWLSRTAGLLLVEDLVADHKLYDVAARVTSHLKGVAFAMEKSEASLFTMNWPQ
ncbi:MAG: hypothetical protein JWM99_1758 [Verrucomicrobiales bacterium]|jgi:hypothetical protein|nr:hypothetical protein [Verrucomicrobiales bacterium]